MRTARYTRIDLSLLFITAVTPEIKATIDAITAAPPNIFTMINGMTFNISAET